MSPMRNVLLGLLTGVLAACTTTGAVSRAAVAQQNTAVVLAFLDTVINKHEVEQAFKLYVAPQYQQHNPAVADGNVAAMQALTHYTHDLYPELRIEVKRTVAQGDLVAVHSRYIKHTADRANGRGQAVVDIFRLEHGKIVEHWDVVQEVSAEAAHDNPIF
ncbi:MAG TPA: nuclear transport factor 2 family protein [Steroidobacteraceae bacterium]|nr:nuclear transport factor 2 family protein [Steroidobacteraceae bacterium]